MRFVLPQNITEETAWNYEDTDAPPLACLTDDNISMFLTERWNMEGKGEIEVATRYINYALSNHQKSNITAMGARSFYPTTFKTLQGIKKSKRWVQSVRNGALPLQKNEAKRILSAPILTLDDLRHKVIASCYINMGFHKSDIARMKDSNLEHHPNYKDRNNRLRPKIVVNGVHTKRPNIIVRNIVACGCSGNHQKNNDNCEYSYWKKYIDLKIKADEELKKNNFKRYNMKRKARHYDGTGTELKEINFMRRLNLKKTEILHGNMGLRAIADGLEYWNQRLGLRTNDGEKITGAAGRKTFCTLGEKYFKFKREALRDVSHHQTNDQFEEYVDNGYIDIEEEAHISRTMQKWAQGLFTPPIHTTTSMMLAELQQSINTLSKSQQHMMKLLYHQSQIMTHGFQIVRPGIF